MGGWVAGQIDGWVGEWMDGWMNRWVDGWMEGHVVGTVVDISTHNSTCRGCGG
jgi:hypothetical protein